MRLTREQNDYISKQYRKYLDGKLSLDQFNENLQMYFNVSLDFKQVIMDCVQYNKGSFDIGWFLYDHA